MGISQFADLSRIVEPGSVQAALITGVLGTQPKPSWAEAIAWFVYLVPVGTLVLWPQAKRPGAAPAVAPVDVPTDTTELAVSSASTTKGPS